MTEIVCENTYVPLPPQLALRRSRAAVKGYGGAMAGGKTRAICEEAWDKMLEYPGISIPIIRQKHTAITMSTRKLFIEKVLPPELRARKDLVRIKNSGGEDIIELWNGSIAHFLGLDDPGKLFSSEHGAMVFDEAHELDEEDVVVAMSRLRQRCPICEGKGVAACPHYPRDATLAFNPMEPGHWLEEWFILGAQRTEFGYRKDELFISEAEQSIGDAEFFVSRPRDNPHIPPDYISKTLAGMKPWQRRRYLDGAWEHVGGQSIFDQESLSEAHERALGFEPLYRSADPRGDVTGLDADNLPKLVPTAKGGLMEIFRGPVRLGVDKEENEIKAHRYIVSVDASSGIAADYSAVQVFDVDEFEQVAEWQGKVDPDRLAEIAFISACVYNGAMLVPEITGGWGFAVTRRLLAMISQWKGHARVKPLLYTRPVVDRLSQKYTDLLGWDTNTKSRAQMIDSLEQALRDGSLTIHGQRTLREMGAFVLPDRVAGVGDYRPPRARRGSNDDLVVAMAIAVHVGRLMPKELAVRATPTYKPAFDATGF